MRKNIKWILTIFLLVISLSNCITKEENKRNRISFSASANEIENSIVQLNSLMKRIPAKNVNNYFFDGLGNIYINNFVIGKPTLINPDTILIFGALTTQEKQNFFENALFLKKNNISGAYYDGLFKTWRYSYREVIDNSFKNYRDIFYTGLETPIADIKQGHEILDTTGKLVLIKAK